MTPPDNDANAHHSRISLSLHGGLADPSPELLSVGHGGSRSPRRSGIRLRLPWKMSRSPLIEGRVCAECQINPDTTFSPWIRFFSDCSTGRGGLLVATPTKLSRMTGCIKGRLDVYLHQFCNIRLAP